MAGLFGMKFEDASEGTRLTEAEPGGLDESETATAAIADLAQEDAERVEADAEADDLGERAELAEELHDEVEPVVTEGLGLDTAGMALLLTGMRRVAGRQNKHMVGKDLKMEAISAGVSGRREQTRIQFENIKDTLKQIWATIKAAFKKAWAKVKTWYIKTFDASKKLKSRAEKIRTRAESMSATIDKKSFAFSGSKTLGKNGKIGTAAEVKTGMANLASLADTFLDVQTSDKLDTQADTLVTLLDALTKTDSITVSKVEAVLAGIKTATGITDLTSATNADVETKVITGLGGAVENAYKYSATLPGDKVIIGITGNRPSGTVTVDAELACIRRTRVVFSNTKDKPKEASGSEAKTATTSEIANICDSVIKIADNVFDFKKGWENRDKHQDRLIKDIDDRFRDIAKDIEDDETNSNASKNSRTARSIASAATDFIRRDSSFKATLVSYLMNTSNVALSYCERSIANHK